MQKIRNIRTLKSYKQKKDKLVALKAKKQFHLKNTDWTQLNDVTISNKDEIKKWREVLRKLKIQGDDGGRSEKKLESILQGMPEPKIADNSDFKEEQSELDQKVKKIEDFDNLTKKIQELQKKLDNINEQKNAKELDEAREVPLDEKQFREFVLEIFKKHKNGLLVDNGILEYNMMRALLEEAIDRRISSDSHGPLLEEYLDSNDKKSIDDIIESCRDFFKNINAVYADLTKEERSLYNMSIDELNNWFKENGHRHRCCNKG